MLAERLLRAAPGLRFLATSQEPLAIGGEQLWEVPPLEQAGAVQLFVSRAAAAAPGFAPDAAEARAVADICRRLDGIPLALELAAARVRALGVHTLAARLDDRFRLLTAGRRGAPARQRTLRAVIDWSWELATEPEQIVLRRLAVHADGCTLTAAEQTCAGEGLDRADIAGLLARLVDRSLVVVTAAGAQEPRYRLLESVAAYGTERLREAGELDRFQRRHRQFYVTLAERARAFATAWLAGISLLAGGDGDAAAARKAYHDVDDPAGQAEADWFLGFTTSDFGDLSLSEDLTGRAMTAFQAAGDRWGVAAALSTRAKHAAARGDMAAVEDHGQRSLELFRELGDRWGQLQATEWLGSRCETVGDYEQGRHLHIEGLRLARELGLWPQAADRLTWLGRIAMLTGDYAQARELLEEARRLAAERAYKPGEVFADISLGALDRREGDLDTADARLRQVLDWHREMGYAPDVGKAIALAELGFVAEQRGDPVAARRYHAEALAITRELGDPRGIALTMDDQIRTS